MNNPTSAVKASSSAFSQTSVITNTSEGQIAKTASQKYTAKRTPRPLPGSPAATNLSRLPPAQHALLNSSSRSAACTAPTETAVAAPSLQIRHFIPGAPSRARNPHGGTRLDLSVSSKAPGNAFRGRESWYPEVNQSSYQDTFQPTGQISTISTRTQHVLDSPSLRKAGVPKDNLYEFTLSAPIMEQPKSMVRIPTETVPVKTYSSPTSNIPRFQPQPTSSSRKGSNGCHSQVYIDLTQDDPSPNSEPSVTANGGNITTPHKAGLVQVAKTDRLGTNGKVNPPSPSISDASSDLPSTSHISDLMARDNPCTPGQKRKRDNRPPDAPNGIRQPAVTSSTSTPSPSVTQGLVQDTIRPASQVPRQDKITAPTETAAKIQVKSSHFDSAAFDTALYQQPDAASPPAGVVIGPRTENKSSSEGRSLYIYANPAIHGMHNRSEAWYERKALEIQSRGGRKFWFGKVSARLRWLERKRTASSKVQDVTGNEMREHCDPEPRAYKRPLDFGDVPESELPEQVRQNPDWLKACEWFREQQNMRDIRLRESKRCEQEANEYYIIISQRGIPDPGTEGDE